MNLDMDPKVRNVLGQLGFIAIRKGLARQAEALFLGLSALDEKRVGPAVGLAQAYMADSKYAEAIGVLLEPAKTDPDARTYLGFAYWLKNDHAKARELWEPLARGEGRVAEAARAYLQAAKEKNPEAYR